MNELQKGRPKLNEIEVIPDDLNSILDMSIKSIKLGRTPKFPETAQGLEDFKQASVDYLEYVREVNNDPENEHHLVPDIESWATFLGTTRRTILTYEKCRSEEWTDYIALVKGAITACKKQLAFRQKIPTVLAMFDLTNNSGYVNSSEFRLSAQEMNSEPRLLSATDLPNLGMNSRAELPQFNIDAMDENEG